MRPFEAAEPIDYLDPDEWSADVADLIVEYSAVIRLGAQLLFSEDELEIPGIAQAGGVPQGAPLLLPGFAAAPAALGTVAAAPAMAPVADTVVIPNRQVRRLLEHPELAWPLKEDLARRLALGLDRTFLDNARDVRAARPLNAALVQRIVGSVRRRPRAVLGNAGWVIHPRSLDVLMWEPGGVQDRHLLEHDGQDTGKLAGHVYVVSKGAQADDRRFRVCFSSDWSQGYIVTSPGLVAIDVSPEAAFQQDEVIVRAVMYVSVTIRHPPCFAQLTVNP